MGPMKRILVIVLITAGVLIVVASFGWFIYEQKIDNPALVSIPDNLDDLILVDQMTGRQAAQDFSQLHGKQFPLTSGAVGIYGNRQATLWVAGTPLKFMAAEMIIAMRDKISEGRSPFTATGDFLDNGRTIYSLEGMGQDHYYFQSNNLIIWLAVDTNFADSALEQLQEVYP
jgi:hypothetical protein